MNTKIPDKLLPSKNFSKLSTDEILAICLSWKKKRWAWEFLRRDPSFIIASGTANDEESQTKVAAEFGLSKFMAATKNYKEDNTPYFLVSRIKVRRGSDKEKVKTRRKTLKPTEINFTIDISPALQLPSSLRSQIRAVEKVVLSEFQNATTGVKIKELRRRNMHDYAILLFVADCICRSKDNKEIGSLLFPKEAYKKVSNRVETLVKQAKALTSGGWQILAVSKDSPSKALRPPKSEKGGSASAAADVASEPSVNSHNTAST